MLFGVSETYFVETAMAGSIAAARIMAAVPLNPLLLLLLLRSGDRNRGALSAAARDESGGISDSVTGTVSVDEKIGGGGSNVGRLCSAAKNEAVLGRDTGRPVAVVSVEVPETDGAAEYGRDAGEMGLVKPDGELRNEAAEAPPFAARI